MLSYLALVVPYLAVIGRGLLAARLRGGRLP